MSGVELDRRRAEERRALAPIFARESKHSGEIHCPRGWWKLVVDLDARLAELDPDYTVCQVKEKFGALRYYTDSDKFPVTEYTGPLPDHWGKPREEQRPGEEHFARYGEHHRWVLDDNPARRLIREAEAESLHICQDCGNDGELRRDLNWHRTLCISHYRQALNEEGKSKWKAKQRDGESAK